MEKSPHTLGGEESSAKLVSAMASYMGVLATHASAAQKVTARFTVTLLYLEPNSLVSI